VVEATGPAKILEDAINYVRRGGRLVVFVVYGVYSSSARVSWPQSKIFGDEITILGSFLETFMFRTTLWIVPFTVYVLTTAIAAAIDYLDSGKVKVAGIVNKTFKLEEWGECLAAMKDKSAIKAAIVFD
jgi:D-arabinitol dehydrogenase (NADP+)